MAPSSPGCSFIHASIAGSRSTAPLNRSNSVVIVARLSAFGINGTLHPYLPCSKSCHDRIFLFESRPFSSDRCFHLGCRLFSRSRRQSFVFLLCAGQTGEV